MINVTNAKQPMQEDCPDLGGHAVARVQDGFVVVLGALVQAVATGFTVSHLEGKPQGILTDGKNPDLFSSIKNRSIWKVKNTQRYPWKSLMKCLIIFPANLLLFCIIQLNVWFFFFFYQPYNPSLNDTLKSYVLIIGELKQKTCIWKRAKP